MENINQNTGLMWEVNYEICDYLTFDGAEELSSEEYRTAANAVLKACETEPELKEVYEPIKAAFELEKRFQAA